MRETVKTRLKGKKNTDVRKKGNESDRYVKSIINSFDPVDSVSDDLCSKRWLTNDSLCR